MDYVKLGSTGLKVSRLCLGTMTYGSSKWRDWVLDEEESRSFIRRALELGINFFDTADLYSWGASEEVLGRALRDFGPSRDRVVVATKVYNPMGDDPNQRGLSRKHIRHAIDDSLKRLGMDYVDLYQIHRFDYETPIEETLAALDDVVKSGKALHVGASSMFAWQFAKMLYTADARNIPRFATMQNHYNLIYREEEREMLPLCREEGIGVIPWGPLARGFVMGNHRREGPSATIRARTDDYGHSIYCQPSDYDMVERITAVARNRGVSNARIALAWIAQRPGITAPVFGASKPGHLEDAVAALETRLDDSELKVLEPYQPHRPPELRARA
jgi:1-deoxyxylulose-5-phosphate synthase